MKLLIQIFIWFNVLHAQPLTTQQAKSHIGESQTVCGAVKGSYYAKNSNGSPTYINLDGSYPNQPFNIVIWNQYRSTFKIAPEQSYKGKNLCITGIIDEYKGIPNIEVKSPSQIQIK
jgi:DNA/RNA endonuclease YhcR with UshA esterase domain